MRYFGGVAWKKNFIYDQPRFLDLGIDFSYFGGLERVPDYQNIPTFFMDRPYKIFAEHTVAYWKKQHEELIAFLEKHSGKKMV